jgi:hypothetical protein
MTDKKRKESRNAPEFKKISKKISSLRRTTTWMLPLFPSLKRS